METPNYVFRTDEAVLMPVGKGKVPKIFKTAVLAVVGILIVGSFLFQDNLFAELNTTAQILLIILAIGVLVSGPKKEYMPSPMELHFFDDYLILYLPKRYYNERLTRMEINKMKYSDISKCVIKTKSARVHIYGDGVSTWWNYRKDGTVPEKPTKINEYTDGLIYFGTRCAPNVDFKRVIEEHSPLQVIVEDN